MKSRLEMVLDDAQEWHEARLEVVVPAVRTLSARGMTVNQVADVLGMMREEVVGVLEGRRTIARDPQQGSAAVRIPGMMEPSSEGEPFADARGGPFRLEGGPSQARFDALRAAVPGLFALGMSMDEVAEILGATTREVRAVLKRLQ